MLPPPIAVVGSAKSSAFLQPRVLFDWRSWRNSAFVSFLIRTDTERMVEAALRASERSIVTALNPGSAPRACATSAASFRNDQMLHILRVVEEFHRGREPPAIAIQDREATVKLFQPSVCKVDWRLFDPETLAWHFDGERYLDALQGLTPAKAS